MILSIYNTSEFNSIHKAIRYDGVKHILEADNKSHLLEGNMEIVTNSLKAVGVDTNNIQFVMMDGNKPIVELIDGTWTPIYTQEMKDKDDKKFLDNLLVDQFYDIKDNIVYLYIRTTENIGYSRYCFDMDCVDPSSIIALANTTQTFRISCLRDLDGGYTFSIYNTSVTNNINELFDYVLCASHGKISDIVDTVLEMTKQKLIDGEKVENMVDVLSLLENLNSHTK